VKDKNETTYSDSLVGFLSRVMPPPNRGNPEFSQYGVLHCRPSGARSHDWTYSVFARYKGGGVAEFQEFLFLKLLFIRYLLFNDNSLVKRDLDPRTRCFYATHWIVCEGTPFSGRSQGSLKQPSRIHICQFIERTPIRVRGIESWTTFFEHTQEAVSNRNRFFQCQWERF
jgi:hypothetical protein